jgi:PKD repeat protein
VTAAGTPDSGTAPLTVSFTATALGGTGPYAYAWDFGDGATGTGADVTHTYAAPGTYQANVTATDAATETAGTAVTIVVAAPPLLLDRCTVTPNPAVVAPGGTQAFTATGFTAANTEIPGATAAWTVTSGLGTISSAGLFTAGSGTGSGEVNATVSYNALSRTCSAAITVQEPTAAPLWPILLVLILVVVLLLLAMWWRRRKPAESPSEPPTYGSIDGGEAPTTLPESAPDDLATRLGRLKDARDKGLLSEEEYLAKREELLRQV